MKKDMIITASVWQYLEMLFEVNSGGTVYATCMYIVCKAITVCGRGSDLSSLPKYYIAELILKLGTHKQASVSTKLWYVPVCPANNNSVSHVGEEYVER